MSTPSIQPQLEPILLPKPIHILHRLPCHTKIDTNHEVKEGSPKVRATLNVYDEEIHGYGMTRDQAMRDYRKNLFISKKFALFLEITIRRHFLVWRSLDF